MTTAENIRSNHLRDYNAWLAQATAYGMPTDDASFVTWWERMEAQHRDRMRDLLTR
jgi:hypothetical protein